MLLHAIACKKRTPTAETNHLEERRNDTSNEKTIKFGF